MAPVPRYARKAQRGVSRRGPRCKLQQGTSLCTTLHTSLAAPAGCKLGVLCHVCAVVQCEVMAAEQTPVSSADLQHSAVSHRHGCTAHLGCVGTHHICLEEVHFSVKRHLVACQRLLRQGARRAPVHHVTFEEEYKAVLMPVDDRYLCAMIMGISCVSVGTR